jgi:ATP-binding cassette subfamily F protein 3
MDEPTIHLDMDSCEVLMDALEQYRGTLIFISHDVTFIRRLARKVLHIHSGRITTYAGGYDYYLRKNRTPNERDGIVAAQGLVNAQPENLKEKNLLISELSAKKLKKMENQRKTALSNRKRELRMLVNKLEREISKLEMQHAEFVTQLQDPSLYEDRDAVEDLNKKLISNREESATRNLEWEKAATELSEMEEQ